MGTTSVRADESIWRDRLERWSKSGLRAKEFAEREGVKVQTLSWWRWELRRRAEGRPHPRARGQMTTATPQFVPLVVQAPAEGTALELVLDGKHTVRLRRDFDETTLLRVMRVLGGA